MIVRGEIFRYEGQRKTTQNIPSDLGQMGGGEKKKTKQILLRAEKERVFFESHGHQRSDGKRPTEVDKLPRQKLKY